MATIDKNFYERDTVLAARELLGKKIVRIYRGKKIEGIITETEAYHGFDDKASHASRGKTERTRVMFGEAGRIYVYLIYGMYHCLNIVTGKKDFPAAVLIRGVKFLNGHADGPGKVCNFLKIDKRLNEKPLSKKTRLLIKDGIKINPKNILSSRRIGVDYAGKWAKKPWRFYIDGDILKE